MTRFQQADSAQTGVSLRGTGIKPTSAAFVGWFDTRAQHSVHRPLRREVKQGDIYFDAPGLQIYVDPSRVDIEVSDSSITLCVGTARRADTGLAISTGDIAGEIARRGCAAWDWLHGRFAIIHVELRARTVTFVTDRFSVHQICYLLQGDAISFSDRADAVPALERAELDSQAIYDYVYFHVIPAPRTIFRNISRLEPSQVVRFGQSGLEKDIWWVPRFEPDPRPLLGPLKSRFLELVHRAVEREVTTEHIGSFLSGGTDSSTIAGMLCRITGRPAQTFSMGFDAPGYDEMSYARVAARHFGTEQHEYYLTPEDLVQSIPRVAASFDQPFGNSSALPAYYCARYANEAGIEKLLAGDGGDELFGGNSRYAKQKVFELYRSLPGALRTGVLEPSLLGQQWPRRVPLLRKLASYVEQARLPMPDRMETYNLLTRFGANELFTDRFLARVQESGPRSLQREIYTRQQASSLINRMLAYDWRFTLADNDLPKVTGAARLAGGAVGFPLLDDDLVDFSLRLSPTLKVRGLTLRYFFKEALKGFLPGEIIRKRKHGFGLPFGQWLVQHEPLQALARTALERIVARGLVRHEFVQQLFSIRLQEHAGYFGEMIWILMMLEEWLQAKAPDYAV
jgi:asparagine synthase (glutamine-hydrolysing)